MLSAGIVVVRKTESGVLFLLLRAYKNWDFPKGLVEEGEDPLDGAKREAKEEAGLDDLQFSWGELFYETEPYNRGKIARYYLAETVTEKILLPVNPELKRPEHHEARWMEYAEARAKIVPRLQAVLDWAVSVMGA